eukprot:m.108213 g.108213  ORF g.108213 m.108213 type:complete len:646 (+) comp27854_c0_seq1:244-2181(+)
MVRNARTSLARCGTAVAVFMVLLSVTHVSLLWKTHNYADLLPKHELNRRPIIDEEDVSNEIPEFPTRPNATNVSNTSMIHTQTKIISTTRTLVSDVGRDTAPGGCEQLVGIDIIGTDLILRGFSKPSIASANDCCQYCNDQQDCMWWTFGTPDGCWLKSEFVEEKQTKPSFGQNLTSGERCEACGKTPGSRTRVTIADAVIVDTATSSQHPDCTVLPGIDFGGEPIVGGYYSTTDKIVCTRACNAHKQCAVWSIGGGACWLKGTQGQTIRKKAATSGTRCAKEGVNDESLPSCSDEISDTCEKEIDVLMAAAKDNWGKCEYRSMGLLAIDGRDVYRLVLSERAGTTCRKPCALTKGNLTLQQLIVAPADEGVELTIAIPSACREQSNFGYLGTRTAKLALQGTKLVVWQSRSAVNNVEETKALESAGFVVKQSDGYPQMELKTTLGDKIQRVRWRSTEVLDYINTLTLAYSQKSKYILVVQDDTFAAPDVGGKLKAAIDHINKEDPEFGFVSFYTETVTSASHFTGVKHLKNGLFEMVNSNHFGRVGQCVALLYRREIIPWLVDHLRENYNAMPVDWMIYSLLAHVGKKQLRLFGYLPNLFQHVGKISTGQAIKASSSKSHTFYSRTFKWHAMAEIENMIENKKM